MSDINNIQAALRSLGNLQQATNYRRFFKDHDQDIFLGVTAANRRQLGKTYRHLAREDIATLMRSCVHDERSIAHDILCLQFKQADEAEKTVIFNFYIENKEAIRDWDAVDDTAPYIVGPYLLMRDKTLLYEWAQSPRIWDRRIAILATKHFIREGHVTDTIKLASLLLDDKEDLIHKAVGWMLREVGKKDKGVLVLFLNQHSAEMPRTMLRYAIEKCTKEEREKYLCKHV